MITLSLNFDKVGASAKQATHEKQIRDIVDTHLSFPGSDKLKMGVTIKDNGSTSVSFTGPKDAIAEAKRLWKENVQPVAAKVKQAAARVTKSAKATTKKVVKKVAKKKPAVRAKVKAVKAKVKAVKAKVTKVATKKRKA